jgi:ribonucleoside-triphosphate reductase
MTNKLTIEQLHSLEDDLYSFFKAPNAASGSKYDSNANVSTKNLVVAQAELFKGYTIQLNTHLLKNKIKEKFGNNTANAYIEDLDNHRVYQHDASSLAPYCASISMYPFLLNGLKDLGGDSTAPTHLGSFCGSFINLVFAIASQFAGAVATVEFIMYFDYFARKTVGQNYAEHLDDPQMSKYISDHFQQVVYSMNQPAGARGYQAVFWNISVFDTGYFNSLFEDFVFPDGDKPNCNSVMKLQEFFMSWFNKERTKALLTFPVVTAAMLVDKETKKPVDTKFKEHIATEMSEGNSFFIYMSDSADSLASCCRLRNEMADNTFSYSLGAGGTMTGSINVMTININRLVQETIGSSSEFYRGFSLTKDQKLKRIKLALYDLVGRVHKYQLSYVKLVEQLHAQKTLTAYDAGFIDLKKQFLTIGINGLVEAAEYLGYKPDNNADYRKFVDEILQVIYNQNKAIAKVSDYRFNTEFVPAENLGVKNAKWDKKAGYQTFREVYNSYTFPMEDETISILDKFSLYDSEMTAHLDGGAALHLNLREHPSKEQWLKLIDVAAEKGVPYWTYNVPTTNCKSCGHIDKKFLSACPECNSTNITHATRIIGYLKEVESFSDPRKLEEGRRVYATV